jgi:hypothetical protein
MTFDLKELDLNSSYEFDVIVKTEDLNFAGELILKPSKITLSIRGEESDERSCPIGWERNLKQIICEDINITFVLHNLRLISGRSRSLFQYPKGIQFFERIFQVDNVIYIPTSIYRDGNFYSINLYSKRLSKWVGYTKLNSNIMREAENGARISSLVEFDTPIENFGSLGVKYNLYGYIEPFKFGTRLSSLFFIDFCSGHNADKIKEIYDKVYNFLAVITGDDFNPQKIEVCYGDHECSTTCYLYYPTKDINYKISSSEILFPLGDHLVNDQLNYPAFPINSFKEFYTLEKKQVGYWEKYIKYRRMTNIEERFLGYFRILESLCFQKKPYLNGDLLEEISKKAEPYLIKTFEDKKNVKSFLKGLPRYNYSKYNTEKNIQDFLVVVPKELSSTWKFTKKDIGAICKLRNDMTHANDYYVEEGEVESKAKFIEVLLLLRLFLMVGIPMEISSKIINRLEGYGEIISIQKIP